jgi:hypothetical protein
MFTNPFHVIRPAGDASTESWASPWRDEFGRQLRAMPEGVDATISACLDEGAPDAD